MAALAVLKQAQIAATEKIYWADADSFDLLPLPVLHGALATALSGPNGLVVNAATARKYFGREDVVGRTLTVDGRPMTVTAVIADLLANGTDLAAMAIAGSPRCSNGRDGLLAWIVCYASGAVRG